MAPLELESMTGPGAIGSDELALGEGIAALSGAGAAAAAACCNPELGEPFDANGAQTRFVLLPDCITTLLPPRKAGASRIVERYKSR